MAWIYVRGRKAQTIDDRPLHLSGRLSCFMTGKNQTIRNLKGFTFFVFDAILDRDYTGWEGCFWNKTRENR